MYIYIYIEHLRDFKGSVEEEISDLWLNQVTHTYIYIHMCVLCTLDVVERIQDSN